MNWQLVLIAVALLAAAWALLLAWRLWRDPFALVRAEYARQRAGAGLKAQSVVIGGKRWAYAERAADRSGAPTLVMVHGYTGSKENWYRLAQRLRGRYRLVIPDLPGWGESQRDADADYGYAAQAENVAAFIRAVCGAPVVLVGHSMGGGIAALTAARHPDLVARVALIDAAGVNFEENGFAREVLAGGNPFGVTDAASLQRYLGIVVHDRRVLPPIPWPVSNIVIAQRRADGAFEQSILEHIGRGADQFLPGAEAARIRQPALLVWGAHDQVIDPSAMAAYAAQIPQARQLLLDRSGHSPIIEQPDEVAAAVAGLVEAAAGRTPATETGAPA
ncbi:alpha/beta fold hydrolase [Luteimonas aquatica]|uniref:alpha/beta fold hydrolase n=1 Tax=Luteimonas aquatica TaxID=450364 RepID=UPI001F57B56D|nr:alpha/beta hydrolase [Luteimonas aquatica]